MKQLTEKDYQDAAKELGCSVAAIKAVAMVESGGRGGFDDEGRLLIRYEGHKFREYTDHQFDKDYPKVSYRYHKSHRSCGKYHSYNGFNIAFDLAKNAALLSCSLGMFQPMGFNYEEMGYESVEAMWDDLRKGEREQLLAFVTLIKKWGLADELKRAQPSDFAAFAKRYNGADYKANSYDMKMVSYYKKYSKLPAVAAQSNKSDAPPAVNLPVIPQTAGNPALAFENIGDKAESFIDDVQEKTENSVGEIKETITEKIDDGKKQVEKTTEEVKSTFQPETYTQYIPQITKSKWLLGGLSFGGIFTTISAKLADMPDWFVLLLGALAGIIITGLVVLIVLYHKQIFGLVKIVVDKKADPTQNNIELVSEKPE